MYTCEHFINIKLMKNYDDISSEIVTFSPSEKGQEDVIFARFNLEN